MKVKFWTPALSDVGVDVAEIDHVLRRIECGHPVAAVADGEIGQNVRALTAEQKLCAGAADKIRFAGARRTQVRRRKAIAQERRRRRPGGGGAAAGRGDHIRRWKASSHIGREGVGRIGGIREVDSRDPGHGRVLVCAGIIWAELSESDVVVCDRYVADRVIARSELRLRS